MIRVLRQCMPAGGSRTGRSSSRARDIDGIRCEPGSPTSRRVLSRAREIDAAKAKVIDDDAMSQVSTAMGSSRANSDGSPSPQSAADYSPWAFSPLGSRDPMSPLEKDLDDPCTSAAENERRPCLRCNREQKLPQPGGLTQEELDEICIMAPPERSKRPPTSLVDMKPPTSLVPPTAKPVDMEPATAMPSTGPQPSTPESGGASSTLHALGFESASQGTHQGLRPAALSDPRAERWPARAGFRRQERADTL